MKWRGRRGSDNIEDRRGQAGGGGFGRGGFGGGFGGGLGGAPRRGRGGIGLGGFGLVAAVLIGWFFGVDLTPLLTGSPMGGTTTGSASRPLSQEDRDWGQFVSVTLADTEEVWRQVFAANGRAYQPVTLVLFSGVTASPCGNASGATGPFYCPGDGKVYLDTDFFATLSQDLGARGDFAAAYVVAHEVAHHVQDELGILSRAQEARARASQAQANAISVRIELQADCLSGLWARAAQDRLGTLEPGDIDEALSAAARIGDDRLQRSAGRVPMPESFTHGTSQQRRDWFARGYDRGDLGACDTFSAQSL